MPTVDPVTRFWIGVAITIAIGVSNGSLALAKAIPAEAIPYVVAWCGIISFVGSTILTALNGFATSNQSRIASAAAIPQVTSIVTSKAMAEASPSDKVTSTPKG